LPEDPTSPSEFEVVSSPADANSISPVFGEMAKLRIEIASLKEAFAKLSKLVDDMEKTQNAATGVAMRYYSYTLYLADRFAEFSRPIPAVSPPAAKNDDGEAVQSYEPEKTKKPDNMFG